MLEGRCLFSTLTVTSLQDSGVGSLRATIAAAQSGDTIVFASTLSSSSPAADFSTLSSSPALSRSLKTGKGNGRGKPTKSPPPPPPPSTPTIMLTSGELLLTRNLAIQGPGAGQLVISGSGSRAFQVAQGSAVTLSGLNISGFSDYWASYPVETPWAGYGGGILNHGTLAASGCTFTGVVLGAEGGAIFSDGTLTLSACTISGGLAQGGSTRGGGVSNWGTATLTNTIISNNAAQPSASLSYPWANQGGGVYNQGTMTLNGCRVSNNSAREMGGGIFNYGSLNLDGSTVSGNTTSNYGGGIYNAGTTTVQNSSSITENSAPYGADVYNGGVLNSDDTSTIGHLIPVAAILELA